MSLGEMLSQGYTFRGLVSRLANYRLRLSIAELRGLAGDLVPSLCAQLFLAQLNLLLYCRYGMLCRKYLVRLASCSDWPHCPWFLLFFFSVGLPFFLG